MNIREQIRESIPIQDMVYELTGQQLNRDSKIKSIYKEEKNPSLHIDINKQRFCCYSSGRHGDVIQFYADFKRIDYKQAMRDLAKRLGLAYGDKIFHKSTYFPQPLRLKTDSIKPLIMLSSEKAVYDKILEQSQKVDKKLSTSPAILQANEMLIERRKLIQNNVYTAFQEFCLSQGINDEAYKYLTSNKRRLNDDIIKHYGLFSINNIIDTVNHLRKNFTRDELIISGLFKDNGNFVFFRHRIIIPFYSNGILNYMRGRYFFDGSPDTDFNKYMSPHNFSTNLYSRRLFNEDIMKTINTGEELWICEGEFDTMVLKQVNKKAVGILGVSSIPFSRINELCEEYKFEPIVAFDNDEAGHKSIQKCAEAFQYPFKVPNFPEGIKDLTELTNYFLTYNRQK